MTRTIQTIQVWGIYKKKYVDEQKKRPPMRCAFLEEKDAKATAKPNEIVLDTDVMSFTDNGGGGTGSHYSLVAVKVYKDVEHHRREILKDIMSKLTPEECGVLFPKSEIAKGDTHD